MIRSNPLLFLLLTLLLEPSILAQSNPELAQAWAEQHVTRLDPSQMRHSDLRRHLDDLGSLGINVKEVGRSVSGREIFQMEFGRGPFRVFLWSQMHGDEPTATSALIDLFAYLQKNRSLPWIASVAEKLTIRAVPMLNPDGAELFQRRNLQYIDINRDARLLATPEGRLLKRLRDDWPPHLGFNLHNQNSRTSVGQTGRQATISLLAVPFDQFGNDNPGRILAKKVCAVIYEALSAFIYGQMARYDDSFNPRAFGDFLSLSGTPIVLIETGGWYGRSEKDLVQLNFVALATVIKSLADGSIEHANPAVYDSLRYNESGLIYDLIVRNATIVNRPLNGATATQPFQADLGINADRSDANTQRPARIQISDVGDLSIFHGLETVDAAGFLVTSKDGVARPGIEATLLFYRRDRMSELDWTVPDLEKTFKPDVVYRAGRWIGKENFEKR